MLLTSFLWLLVSCFLNFTGIENLFRFEIIGIVSCLSLNQLALTRRPSYLLLSWKEYDVANLDGRIRFLVDVVKLCRWIIWIQSPNNRFHLIPGQKAMTSNGHSITWCKEGLLKEFQSPARYLRTGVCVSAESLENIFRVHRLRLPHIEWGYQPPGVSNAVMITRVDELLMQLLREFWPTRKYRKMSY